MTSSESSRLSRRTLLRTTAAAGAAAAAGTLIHPGTASAAPAIPPTWTGHDQSSAGTTNGPIPTPAEDFGTPMGTEGFLAQWDKMVPYFQLLGARSERVHFEEIGKSTRGYPYVLLTISSPKNLANLDKLVATNARLADPRGLSEAD